MILPLTTNPSESFNYNVNGEVYKFKQKWSTLGFWTLDIVNITGTPYIYGVKLLAKTNLLEMHPDIPFDLRSERLNDPSRNNLNEFELEILEKNNG